MVDTTIRIIVDPSGAVRGTRVVNGALNSTTARAKATTSAVQFLRRSLALLGVGFGALKIVQFADTFTALQNRLRVAGIETENLGTATDRLREISNRTRTDLESNVGLFQRLGIAQKQLGATTEELFQFVENVGSALAIQGGAAGTARGAILQLSQAVGSTIVRGEEFNSILEGAFPVALAAAQGMERFEGSVSKLRTAVIEGQVSSEEFFRAILSQGEELAEQFSRTTPTISQAFTVLNNELTVFIGQLDQAQGLSSSFARSIIDLSLNLETAAQVAGVFVAALSPAIFAGIIRGLQTAALAAAGLIVALGPFGTLASIIAAAAAAINFFGDEIKPVEGSLVSLKDIAIATFNVIVRLGEGLFETFQGRVSPAVAFFGDLFTDVMRANIASFEGFGSFVKTIANGLIKLFRSVVASVGAIGTAIGQLFTGDFGGLAGTGSALRQSIANILDDDVIGDLVANGKILVSEFAKAVLAEAESVRALRDAASTAAPISEQQEDVAAVKRLELTKKQQSALRSLKDALDPVGAAQRDVAEAQELLSNALAAGAINLEEYTDLSIRLGEEFRDQLDPLGAINDELERERELLMLSSSAREVEIELLQIEEDLRARGVVLSAEERASLQANIEELNRMQEARDIAINAFNEMEDALVSFVKTGKLDFSSLVDSIIDDLLRLAIQQAIIQPLQSSLFGGGQDGGGGLIQAGSQALQDFFAGSFAHGGTFTVPGVSGVDETSVRLNATAGEQVTVTPPGITSNRGGGNTFIQNFNFPNGDADSIRQNRTQIAAEAQQFASAGLRRNG